MPFYSQNPGGGFVVFRDDGSSFVTASPPPGVPFKPAPAPPQQAAAPAPAPPAPQPAPLPQLPAAPMDMYGGKIADPQRYDASNWSGGKGLPKDAADLVFDPKTGKLSWKTSKGLIPVKPDEMDRSGFAAPGPGKGQI